MYVVVIWAAVLIGPGHYGRLGSCVDRSRTLNYGHPGSCIDRFRTLLSLIQITNGIIFCHIAPHHSLA